MGFIDTTKYLLSKRNEFTFSGSDVDCEIVYKKNGIDSFEGFRMYDEKGKRFIETKHPETVRRLVKTKASLTFQIKEWAESRADGTLPKLCFNEIQEELNLPAWVVNAVETQKVKFYK